MFHVMIKKLLLMRRPGTCWDCKKFGYIVKCGYCDAKSCQRLHCGHYSCSQYRNDVNDDHYPRRHDF